MEKRLKCFICLKRNHICGLKFEELRGRENIQSQLTSLQSKFESVNRPCFDIEHLLVFDFSCEKIRFNAALRLTTCSKM